MLFPEFHWLIWLTIGVMLLVLEVLSPAFMLFFFGIGALITAAVCWGIALFTPENLAVVWQLLIFLVTSLLSLFALRSRIRRRFEVVGKGDLRGDDSVLVKIGARGVVSIAVKPPAEGQMKCGGSFWRISANEEIAEGEIVAVVRDDDLRDLRVHVERVK